MRIEIDFAKWQEGFRDGEAGRPSKVGAGYSYYSGWVEGDAWRQGCGKPLDEHLRPARTLVENDRICRRLHAFPDYYCYARF